MRRSARLQQKPSIEDTQRDDVESPAPKKLKRAAAHEAELPLLSEDQVALCTTLAQPRLSFSLEDARDHLCKVDARFSSLFAQMDLKAYKDLESVRSSTYFAYLPHPFLGSRYHGWLRVVLCTNSAAYFHHIYPRILT